MLGHRCHRDFAGVAADRRGRRATQSTEGTIGPYELHDFFLYHFLRFGAAPEKILFLAKHAKFHRDYAPAEVRKWLAEFLKRFFASQYKRSVLPDGPKVGTVSLIAARRLANAVGRGRGGVAGGDRMSRLRLSVIA